MLNILLNTVIFLICCSLGYIKSQKYSCRVVNLQSFLDGMEVLKDEISYRKTPLPQALEQVAFEKSDNACKSLFEKVSEKLTKGGNMDFNKCWSETVTEIKENGCLDDEEVRILRELGNGLGGTDIYGQSAVIERGCRQLESQLKLAVEEKNTKGKMYKGLGAAVGLALVIILI